MRTRKPLSEVSYHDKEFLEWEADLVGSVSRHETEDSVAGENITFIQARPGPSFTGRVPSYYLPMLSLKQLRVFSTSGFESLTSYDPSVGLPKTMMRVSHADYVEAEKEDRVFL